MTDDLWYLSAQEVGALLRQREVSALETVQAFLERIEDLDSQFNAYITVTAEEALEAARQRDAELAAGQDRGPLHGIPVAVKDLYDTAGVRTTSGSKILANNVPSKDATSVAKLRAAGAIVLGKTNLNEFACGVTTENPHYGDTHNPWNPSCIAGGSSGGSAAAVAAGLCTIATGTDTGGSVRIPGALCGIVGLKPSYGRISTHGIMPLSWEQDHPGPMTRTVYDAAIMLQAMAGWDVADPATVRRPVPDYAAKLGGDIKGLRVGLDRRYALSGISAEVRSAFETALEVLADLGARIVQIQVPRLEEGQAAGVAIWNSEATAVHEEWLRTRPEDYDPSVRVRLEKARTVKGQDYARAQRTRRQLMRELQTLFDQVDVFATPMSGLPAPAHGAKRMVIDGQEFDVLTAFTHFSRVFNLTGSPSVSVPCGFASSGLPIGLQLVGALFDEGTVLRAAHAYEQATDWHERRPPIPGPAEKNAVVQPSHKVLLRNPRRRQQVSEFPREWAEVQAIAHEVLHQRAPGAASSWLDEKGGYGTGWSFRRNREVLDKIAFEMRLLQAEQEPVLETTTLGQKLRSPIMIAPMTESLKAICGEETLALLGRGARLAGTVTSIGHPVSTEAMTAMAQEGAPLFRTIKPLKDREVLVQAIREAEDAGCFAVAVDVDAQTGLNSGGFSPHYARFTRPLSVGELQALRKETPLPFILKGIMSVSDAQTAVEIGADAIIVSNHGGHALDYCLSSIEVLPEIAAAVGEQLEIWFDSGVRRGTDVLKALALGAKVTLIGRLAIWGLALGGAEGVAHVFDLLNSELRRTMVLTGVHSVESVSPDTIVQVD